MPVGSGLAARLHEAPTTIASVASPLLCHPAEEMLHERLADPEEAVAPDGGRTDDVRDRLVVDDDPHPQDDLESSG